MSTFTVNTPEILATTCRLYANNRVSQRVFHASVCEAAKAGVDWRAVLTVAGIDPASLPNYASLVL